ncbi:mitochondrial inner-membrane-bound regulator-domain-containing protein [Biscogniauxia mediterranea]|nr:mitochondrial inner-membrane-bound regulator-domain-containing protein [Biscogniauxia mediterranea]
MISRGISSGNVCLGCRLRILRQHSRLLRPISPVNRTFDLRFVSSSFSSSSSTPGFEEDGEWYERRSRTGPDEGSGEDPAAKSGKPYRRLASHKKRLSGRRLLTETSSNLGLDMLGKPARAIVMKDGGIVKDRTGFNDSESIEVVADHEVADIEAMLESRGVHPTADDVHSYIDSLKPQTDTTMTEKEFRKLQNLLVDGFLSSQLISYYNKHNKDHRHLDLDDALKESGVEQTASESAEESIGEHIETKIRKRVWIKSISPWVPLSCSGSATKGEEMNPSLRGYIPPGAAPKERLAIRILRECWGLTIAELTVGLGETQVKLRNHEFVLLMRGTQRFMNTLSHIWLEPGERIEAIRNQKVLRLITTKPKAEAVLQDLSTTLNAVKQSTFPSVLIAPDTIDDDILEEVGRVTNTHLRWSSTSRRIHVTWIEPKSRKDKWFGHVEDLRHVAFRLLLTALRPRYVSSELYGVSPQTWSQGRFVIDSSSREKLGWKDKMSRWGRYVLPVSRRDESSTTSPPFKELGLPFEPESTFSPKDAFVLGEPDPNGLSPTRSSAVQWSSGIRTSTVARFGYLLHPYNSEESTSIPATSSHMPSQIKRVFAPMTPHPRHFAKLKGHSDEVLEPRDTQPKTIIVLRFWPSPEAVPVEKPPKMSPKDKKRLYSDERRAVTRREKEIEAEPDERLEESPAPILELRVAASDKKILGVDSLIAITRTHHTDVLLPSSPVDLRFTQTQYAVLQAKDRPSLAAWQPIIDYLSAARLDFADGKLEMPPHQRFPVPRRLFATANSTADDEQEDIRVQYTFVGLEVHRSISQLHEDHRLTYTSIEAGRGGGRRAEITLEPLPEMEQEENDKVVANEMAQERFLDSSFNIATNKRLWSVNANDVPLTT